MVPCLHIQYLFQKGLVVKPGLKLVIFEPIRRPTTDDNGNTLKFECVAVDVESSIPVVTPSSIMTSRVILAPCPIPRRIIEVSGEDVLGHLESDGRVASFGTVTVLSYNILADLHTTNKFSNHVADNLGRRQLLCVANTHVNVPQELAGVKLWKVHTLLKGLEKIALSSVSKVDQLHPHALLAMGKVDQLQE
ncbi:hypothetical protein IEQ34_026968 [Dendrobium chrysotoxum]|uniref:Uncharacterized protein n=1 Tax=Dendrobium chrysotoxum TaxID=161865 RepID=A0AAV7FIA4_DENCH|nr:hypothetical protein IEQ34_026968 [Dendrobium chrysotoxum]